jgi:hypothetical protein
MSDTEMSQSSVVMVSYNEFEKFLETKDIAEWEVFPESGSSPLDGFVGTTVELMDKIRWHYGVDHDEIYVFMPYEDVNELIETVDWENVPRVDAIDLEDYVIHSKGSDFLYVTFSEEDACSGFYVNLSEGSAIDLLDI